ncbi:hypothetical protein HAZT_HAZT008554 [Hyalella azteca]|uniref:F-ATPase delta subunit n=1 Tax=Hyalella azteca TaxID=294128 RepID=A0A6A0GZW7_HYAAZ|nr:hypothetical protein HAZT_HAZT008554 [Hyalella azteca]
MPYFQVFYNQADVKQVDVPSFSGSFGILPAHVPSLAVLKPGVVTVYEQSGSAKKIFVSSGIVTINEDSSVQLLAEEAVDVADLDVTAARELYSLVWLYIQLLAEEAVGVAELDVAAAREVLSKSQGAVAAAASEEAKAEALIAVEVAEELVKAAEA